MEIMHKKIWEQREKMGGINASRENNQAIAKQARCAKPPSSHLVHRGGEPRGIPN